MLHQSLPHQMLRSMKWDSQTPHHILIFFLSFSFLSLLLLLFLSLLLFPFAAIMLLISLPLCVIRTVRTAAWNTTADDCKFTAATATAARDGKTCSDERTADEFRRDTGYDRQIQCLSITLSFSCESSSITLFGTISAHQLVIPPPVCPSSYCECVLCVFVEKQGNAKWYSCTNSETVIDVHSLTNTSKNNTRRTKEAGNVAPAWNSLVRNYFFGETEKEVYLR